MSWPEFYKDRLNNEYLSYAKERYADHINAIDCNLRVGDSVHEIACGTGTITAALMQRHRPFCAFEMSDYSDEMMDMAAIRLPHVVTFKHDALHGGLPISADIVHSHGLLEHFSDAEIRRIIQNHSATRLQVHYVPGEYPVPSYGDERLMPLSKWVEICQPTTTITFNDGKDYCLIFRNDHGQ